MADRSVTVRLRAEVNQFKAGMREAQREVQGLTKATEKSSVESKTALGRMTESAQKNRAAWTETGIAVTAAGVAMGAALVGSTKAAIEWETAFTGVLKTVEGTPKQLAAIEDGLRAMARELPISQTELAGVAEAAGQLGIQTDSILEFTRTMVDLGQTTNLTADEAATSIAQMMNVMQSAPDDVDNIGAALVALGNNGASTERDIVQMAQRIAGAGSIIGLSEADVLAFANALASVGIEVEAGGTAISRTMTDIAKAVAEGGEGLAGWAEIAGVSADEFAQAFNDTPEEAITLVVEGLGRLDAAGGNVFATLDKLGQSDRRVSDALLRLSGSGDLLRNSLQLGSDAFAENTALAEEAEKRYATTAAQIQIAKNNFVDAGISIGQVFLPAVESAARLSGNLAGSLGEMRGPVRAVAAGTLALATAATLAAGGFLLLAPRIVATKAALATMPIAAGRATTAMRGLGRAAAAFAAATVVLGGIKAIQDAIVETSPPVEKLTADLLNLTAVSGFTGATEDLDDLAESIDRINTKDLSKRLSDSFGGLFGVQAKSLREAKEDIDLLDQSLTSLVEAGRADEAARILEMVAVSAGLSSTDVARLKTEMDGYSAALASSGSSSQVAADGIQIIGSTAEESAEMVDALKAAMEELTASFSDEKAQIEFRGALDDFNESFKDLKGNALDGAKALDTNTEAGRNAKTQLIDMIEKSAKHAETVLQQTGNVDKYNGVLKRERKAIMDAAEARGVDRRKVRELLAELDKMPIEKNTDIKVNAVDNRPQWLRDIMAGTGGVVPLVLKPEYVNAGVAAGGRPGSRAKKAAGGPVYGPGGPTDDLIPAMLSNGEYVIRAGAVATYGLDLFDAINAGRFAAGGLVGYASGGPVTSSTQAVSIGQIVAAWREAMGIITAEELKNARERRDAAKANIVDEQRSLRDARRGVRDTKESNRDSIESANQAVNQAKRDKAAAERAKNNAKNAKERAKAEREIAKAEKAIEDAKADRKRTRRDNAERTEEANYRLSQAEQSLADARAESTQATADAAQAEKDYAAGKGSPTSQLSAALGKDIKDQGAFIANIEKLAQRGYGTLAAQLLAQGDEEAATIAADAVKQSDATLNKISGQITASQGQQAKLDSLPTVFTILGQLAKDKNTGVAQMSWITGIDPMTLQAAAATSKALIESAGGAVFLEEMARNGFASGGFVSGGGSSTSDSIAARLSNGEYVVQASAVKALGVPFLDALNNGSTRVHGGGTTTTIAPQITLAPQFHGITDTREITDTLNGLVDEMGHRVVQSIRLGRATA